MLRIVQESRFFCEARSTAPFARRFRVPRRMNVSRWVLCCRSGVAEAEILQSIFKAHNGVVLLCVINALVVCAHDVSDSCLCLALTAF